MSKVSGHSSWAVYSEQLLWEEVHERACLQGRSVQMLGSRLESHKHALTQFPSPHNDGLPPQKNVTSAEVPSR